MTGLSSIWARSSDIVIDRGEGIYLYAADGTQYMDFTSGIGVTSTGHCHPSVVGAITAQAKKLIFGQLNIVLHRSVLDLIDELTTIVPRGLDTFFFSNSGAEAIEAAVKLAKHAAGRTNIVVFQGSFHGRTHLAMTMTTSKTGYRRNYQPLVPGIFTSPYPYAFYYGMKEEEARDFALKELRRLFVTQTAPEETACIVVEPILGEGGYVVPPKGFLKGIRDICDEYGILMIADEIQSGIGRTGAYFAVDHEDITPDIMTMAKGIGSGMPLSCIAYKKSLDDAWITGSHGGTYGGNPLACAAGTATIRVLKEEKLHLNARERGAELLNGLRVLQKEYVNIGDVRGRGLMVAAEFTKDGGPDGASAKAIVKKAQECGLLLLTCGVAGHIIRWIPPLIVTKEQIEEALKIFKDCCRSVL